MRPPIDPATRVGPVHLTITDLNPSIRFYEERLGLAVHRLEGNTARLGARGGVDLLVLTASGNATRARGTTGLYHFAVLVPSRAELAQSLRRLIATGTVLQGVADHGVSEALYLADPDGNGIEIYRDRPRAEWPTLNGQLRMGTDPLDLDALLDEPSSEGTWTGPAPDTVMGHVHLHVSQLSEAEHFYVNVLGFELMQQYGRAALFVSAGGYHHHIGLNTWMGVGAPPPPPGALGLGHFVVRVPCQAALDLVARRLDEARWPMDDKSTEGERTLIVRDPSQNQMAIVAGT